MGLTEEEARAVQLAAHALKSNQLGRAEDASKALKEAISLAPNNSDVKEALETIQSDDALHPLSLLIQRLIDDKDEEAGNEAINYLARSPEVPADVAADCLRRLLKDRRTIDPSRVDRIVAGLLRECTGAKAFLAKRLSESATLVFQELYELGDGSASALASVVLDVRAWSQEATRDTAERDVFQLFLAKLMEVGHDHDGKALKGIARLLATDSEELHNLLDEATFAAILCSLDNRLPIEVRSQAMLATAKYLEASPSDGQKLLLSFIQSRIARQGKEDLVLAFSAAAAVFPLVPSMASAFFLIEGFLPSLVPLLGKKAQSKTVKQAALEMLNAACIDTACRQGIQKHCSPWLQQVADNGKQKSSGLAAVILAKMQGSDSVTTNDSPSHSVVQKLQRMMIAPDSTSQDASIEGLAYASSKPDVKEELVNHKPFLEALISRLKSDDQARSEAPRYSTTAFGVLSILHNLTRYPPNLSEEQKKMAQLKAYANASPSSDKQSPLDSEAAVTARCNTISTQTALVPTLVSSCRQFSAKSTALMLAILLSLCQNKQNRGRLAQQGAAKLLLQTYTSISGVTPEDKSSRFMASHALSRILVSCDPALVFPASGSPPLSSTIRPLVTLLSPPPETTTDTSTPRDLLPTFESLLALTNLASSPDPSIAEQIVRLATPDIEELILSNNPHICRAATELCCNLTSHPSGVGLFASPTPAARRRINILLALANSEDIPTRRAAGGALSGILETDAGVAMVLDRNGIERLVCLAEDDDEGCAHRGMVSLGNLASSGEGRVRILEVQGLVRIRRVVERAKGDVRSTGEEVLGAFGG